VAHAVHVNDREIELLAESGSWVSHQPRSNMNNAVGVAEVEDMLRAGVNVCLGNDGFSNAMWEEWTAAYLVHKVWRRDPRRMSGGDIIQMAVRNNSDLASRFFPSAPVGVIDTTPRPCYPPIISPGTSSLAFTNLWSPLPSWPVMC
jgi:cytosine/adenosine deaminase-related metal-dependent hydrolase